MNKSLFYYDLPEKYIAKTPEVPRDHAKLMVVNRATREISHHFFYELPNLLPKDTVIVRNNSKVVKARLLGNLASGAKAELFFLESTGKNTCLFMTKPGKKFQPNTELMVKIENLLIKITVLKDLGNGIKELHLDITEDIFTFLEIYGSLPLPPYMHQENPNEFESSYQTHYASTLGSVAAPTAGLHFTPELEKKLNQPIYELTLHVGAGTFLPVKTESILDHTMHYESFCIDQQILQNLHNQKIVAIGTTTTRALESLWNKYPTIETIPNSKQICDSTNIFIFPPYQFKAVDHLITNFHLPESTLLMLVSAFIGDISFTMSLYEIAKEHNYRFYSFGDAMLII